MARALPASQPIATIQPRPSDTYSGVPGGCGMPNPFAAAMNSPASQKVTPGAIVDRYTSASATPTAHAARRGVRPRLRRCPA